MGIPKRAPKRGLWPQHTERARLSSRRLSPRPTDAGDEVTELRLAECGRPESAEGLSAEGISRGLVRMLGGVLGGTSDGSFVRGE